MATTADLPTIGLLWIRVETSAGCETTPENNTFWERYRKYGLLKWRNIWISYSVWYAIMSESVHKMTVSYNHYHKSIYSHNGPHLSVFIKWCVNVFINQTQL